MVWNGCVVVVVGSVVVIVAAVVRPEQGEPAAVVVVSILVVFVLVWRAVVGVAVGRRGQFGPVRVVVAVRGQMPRRRQLRRNQEQDEQQRPGDGADACERAWAGAHVSSDDSSRTRGARRPRQAGLAGAAAARVGQLLAARGICATMRSTAVSTRCSSHVWLSTTPSRLVLAQPRHASFFVWPSTRSISSVPAS